MVAAIVAQDTRVLCIRAGQPCSPLPLLYDAPMPHDAYLQPYRESIDRHGVSFEATLWASRQSQRIRFKTFTEMCSFTGKCLLDAGCSRGDLAEYLIDQKIAFNRYIGIDGVEEVIDHARKQNLPHCEFFFGDLIADETLLAIGYPDVICISGTLNTMTDAQMMKLLEASWRAAGEVLIFNFLSDRCGSSAVPQQHPARRMDTMKLIDWALKRSCLVTFRQDYFESGHDATILMRKGQ